jgi:outer membrane protein assembly factor BamB
MRFTWLPILIIAFTGFALSCSSANTLVEPGLPEVRANQTAGHYCLGYYQFTADPVAKTLECIPLRDVAMHLNALRFLEPPPLKFLTLDSLEFNGDIIEADVGLRHPFLGLNEFTGFDVCGIFITSGSKADFDDPQLRMAVKGDTRMLNPDGYSRWWNPAEFPHDTTMFGYSDGLLGTPDSVADYNCTLNAYKFYCDKLTDPDADVGGLDPSIRCIFSAGQKNVRHYTIELGSQSLTFNYAVDASWQFPNGPYPWHVPDDFPPPANRPEAWYASVTEAENTLWNDGVENGGELSLLIDLWDHYNAGMNTIKVESPGNFTPVINASPVGGGPGYSTYQFDITEATPGEGSIELLISAECEVAGYGGAIPGKPITAYFTRTVTVKPEHPPTEEFHKYWAGHGYNHYNLCSNPTPQTLDPLNLTLAWKNTSSGSPSGFKTGSPAVADGKVFYVCNTSGYYYANTQYYAYCLDLTDGHEIWNQPINMQNDQGRALSSLFWYEDKVYTGGDSIYCFNDENGALIWKYDGDPPGSYKFIANSPKVYKGKVYCTSLSNIFVCLDADTGAELWTYPYDVGELLPATDGERVYFPSQTILYCCDCTTGALIWSQPIQGSAVAWSGPTLAGDRIYQHGWYGWLHCFNKYTGDLIWTYDLPDPPYLNAMPAQFVDPADGKLVFAAGSASGGSPIFATKDDGPSASQFWTQVYSPQGGSPYYDATCTIYKDYIIISDRFNHQFFVIDKISSELLATYPVDNSVSAQIAIAYDRLVVLTDSSVECYM